ncbi:hypothetical protein DAPPUDRAFT_249696 [Daphnia pulex]|uniref:Uncharacterized protein n=1 Tax=Daphnia pulex TaxID=6669 RepID=E9GX46_DAPPU|nr:hypothetical protein DAPPUDRAFT_249696 [Daphnia pulex]|eukprot:EFX75810.1 hypothetical protein DAPPUDRAFT_249696 [Daphnia pulex]
MVLGIIWKPSSDMVGFCAKIDYATYTSVGLLSKGPYVTDVADGGVMEVAQTEEAEFLVIRKQLEKAWAKLFITAPSHC